MNLDGTLHNVLALSLQTCELHFLFWICGSGCHFTLDIACSHGSLQNEKNSFLGRDKSPNDV
eukprot:363499-Amphidinium_carterae.1